VKDHAAAIIVTVVAVIAATVVDVSGGDPGPYINLATAGLGFGAGAAAGSAVSYRRRKKN